MAITADKTLRSWNARESDSTFVNGTQPGLLETKPSSESRDIFIGFKSPFLPLECSHYTFKDFNFLLIIINKAAECAARKQKKCEWREHTT